MRESQRDRATRDVKASLIVDRIADREAVEVMNDEVDREVHRIAKQRREPVAAVRAHWRKTAPFAPANHIRTEKALNLLFENAARWRRRSRAVSDRRIPAAE